MVCLSAFSGAATGWELVAPLTIPSLFLLVMFLRRNSVERIPYDERVLATVLACSRCPSCGYSLRDTRESSDGATSCPECGSAWIIPDPATLPLRRPGVPDPFVSETVLPVADRISSSDGRGRAVWVTDPRSGGLMASWRELPEEVRTDLTRRFRLQARGARIGWVLLGLLMLFLAVRGLRNWGVPGSGYAAPVGVACAIFFVLAARMSIRRRVAVGGDIIAQLFLNRWACPSCVAVFKDPAAEPDGCINCPMCNAAWRVRGSTAHSPGTVPER